MLHIESSSFYGDTFEIEINDGNFYIGQFNASIQIMSYTSADYYNPEEMDCKEMIDFSVDEIYNIEGDRIREKATGEVCEMIEDAIKEHIYDNFNDYLLD